MSKVQIATVALMVTRDAMTILPTLVPKHEFEIQKVIFGEENVQENDDQSEAGATEIDLATESDRLEAKYGPGALEKAFGANYKGAIARAAKEFVVKPEKAADADAGLAEMTKAQLLEEAVKRGVKADESMNKAAIVAAIEAGSAD